MDDAKGQVAASAVMLAGALLFYTMATDIVGALLVAGGAYALILPKFVQSEGSAARSSR
ncbi:hypothetical protein [Halomicrobium mukohataei]|uniref:hypothetical protein n=1 Tax=Halomicrobium mukohataei TaxID=57705 RepID=UPI00147662EC|nr:hypothetical protein [Halomicrobium mukohataei]